VTVMASRRARLVSHVRVPLYRNAYSLMLSGAGNALLGMLFWAFASHRYTAEVVGISSAAVAALMFLTGVGGLYLDGALYRFLPRGGAATGRLIGWTSVVIVLTGALAAGVFLLGIDLWAPALTFLDSSPWIVLTCLGVTVCSCLLILQDGALIGLRRTGWVPVKNVVTSAAKIVAVVALAGIAPRYGILIAWALPTAFVVVIVGFILARYLAPLHREKSLDVQEAVTTGQIARYTLGNYVGFLCTLAYRTIPPLLVIHEAGPAASAYFYPPWLIASSLNLMTTNMSISLVVEGSLDRERLALQTRQALRQTARLILPIAVILFVGAPYVLRIFGPAYANAGAGLLRLLAISLIPSSICVLGFGVARIRDHVAAIIANQVPLAVLVLGLSAALLPSLGLEGVGVAWLIAQTTIAVTLGWTELRPALRHEGARPAPVTQRETVLDIASHTEE
jgi:O-antigen/teichoic acid export membrane protein